MPYRKTTVRRRRESGSGSLTPERQEWLLFGFVLGEPDPFTSEDAEREVWRSVSAQILRAWIAKDEAQLPCRLRFAFTLGGPFTRPYAWWKFDAPELRRVVLIHDYRSGETPSIVTRPPTDADIEKVWSYPGRSYGTPCCYCGIGISPEFETEADYLRRLGLLRHGEL